MFRSAVIALGLLASPALADTVTVETYRGPVAVQTDPETVAVFDIAILDALDALGVPVDGVVSPVYLDYLEDAARGATPVGSLFEPDFEAIAALAPDLILAGGRSQKAVPDLARLAPTLDMTIWEDPIAQGLARLTAYGEIFGKQQEAAALIRAFEAKAKEARKAVAGKGKALIVMTNGPKIAAYGAGGRFGWIHQALALPEAVETVEQSTHGEAISFEFIRKANPDILVVVDRLAAIGQNGASARATLDNALVHETNAWKTGRIVYLESAPVYIAAGGIQSSMRILDQFIAALSGS